MHVIVRALLLPWIVTFAAAAGVVKLNTKADPVEAVVEVFKHLHPAASSAALAVAKNGVASVLKGLEASDTSTENVAFEDENERRRAAPSSPSGRCSDITSREVCKNAANKADCSWSKSREKCKSKRKKCAEVKNKKTCHKKKYANICAWSFKKEKCRNAKCEEIDDERDCMSEGARKRGCKWKNNQERCIVDKDAGGGGSVTPTPAPTTAVVAWIQRGDDIDGEAADDQSGVSVSLSADGMVLAVGADGNDGAGSYAGHARVFAWDSDDETWIQRGDDIDGEAAYDLSGVSVSLSADGTALAVGAHENDGAGSNAGHARVFARDFFDETWKQRGDDIDGEAADDQSGVSVSLSADGMVLARGDDIDGEAAYDLSGVSVSLSADGTALAVGAPYNGGAGSTRTWKQRGDDIDGEAAFDYSGYSVSLSADGTTLAVGAAYNGGAGSYAGHARVFAWDSVDDTWIQRGDDIDGEAADDYSGYSVSLSADGAALAVGAYENDGAGSNAGHARVFAWDPVDETWKQRGDDIDGEAAFDYSGYSVSLSADGTTLAVGAAYNGGAGSYAGHARVFAWDSVDDTWIQRGDDIDGEAADDYSGYSVSLSADGAALAVGAPYNGGAGYDAGHARVYSISL
ncbi:hypothetical protein JL720_1156 [Aureococcus anophagefferens]|nr:hypothetical protein JL720_1156 [Aureococcus anophagefferens]